jgi:hypothetical protein
VPVTGTPAVVTATLFSVPPAAVTVIPFDGSAPPAPFPGVIVTTGPAGDGFPVGEADRPADCAAPLAPDFSMAVVVLPVQAATVSASVAPAVKAENARIALMPTPYLMAC